MASTNPEPAGGGFPIAVGAVGGAFVGMAGGQPTLGFLAGLAGGIAVAVALWWSGRR